MALILTTIGFLHGVSYALEYKYIFYGIEEMPPRRRNSLRLKRARLDEPDISIDIEAEAAIC